MNLEIDPVVNHRSREAGSLVYPVFSRRSRGLSVGINLFPQKKVCSFDCPYCEVFPFRSGEVFDLAVMEETLVSVLEKAGKDGVPVKDISFSGNGEPSLSPFLSEALEKVFRIRKNLVPNADIVLITNGTGLLDAGTFDFLAEKALEGLRIWLKIDAASEEWFKKINRPAGIDFSLLINRVRDFAAKAPFIVQTMLCKVAGVPPPREEERAWIELLTELALGRNLRGVQVYGKARPAPEDPLAGTLELSFLEKRAAALRAVLEKAAPSVPVEVFP